MNQQTEQIKRTNSSFVHVSEVVQEVIKNLKNKLSQNIQPEITNSQTATIFSLAKQRGISQVKILDIIQTVYNKQISELTIFEASHVIETLLEEVKSYA